MVIMMLSSNEKLIELIEFGNEIKEIINLWDPLKIFIKGEEDEKIYNKFFRR